MSDEVRRFMKGVKKVDRDFEAQWLAKFSKSLDETVSEKTRRKVLRKSKEIGTNIDPTETVQWTKETMEQLDALVDENDRKKIMTGCACRFPEQRLLQLRTKYEETNDLDAVHKMLQDMFVTDLREGLALDDDSVNRILDWEMGVAGVKRGNKIIATKLPFELREYLEATDPQEKRYHYCHCPRIRETIKSPQGKISKTYCYCGAGFYKHIWETILQRPVEVEVLETVLEGSNHCKIAIYLPNLA